MPAKSSPPPLPDHAVELIAARFRVLSEPARLRLLMALEDGECSVTELVKETRIAQANVSRHLRSLAEAGIVARRRAGTTVFYRISDPSIFQLCECVCGSLRQRLATQAKIAAMFDT